MSTFRLNATIRVLMMMGVFRSSNNKAVCGCGCCAFTARLRSQGGFGVISLDKKLNNALQRYDVVTRDVAARADYEGSVRFVDRGRRGARSGKVDIMKSTRRKQLK